MKPNILLIIADDLNSWIGALERNPDVQTPHIDRLANSGVLFTHAYCSAPYCNASRISLFSGCLPSTTGVYRDETFWKAPHRRPTFIELLKADGYYTLGGGKVFHGVFDYAICPESPITYAPWRSVQDHTFLWDKFEAFEADLLPNDRPINRMVYFANSGGMSPWYQLFDWGPLPNGSFADMPDAAVANFVGSFLRNPRHEPFFCAAGLYKPHLPWHVPREFFDLYDPESLSLPLVKANDLDDVPPLGQKWAMSPPDHSMVLANDQWRAAVHGYLAAVSYADHMIGQIVDSIDSELMKRTIIVILGEHGFHLGEKSHWRKFALWEEATRVPLIMLMPGSVASRRVHVPVSLVDVFPTILELCGTPSHEAVDGESLSASVDSPQFMRRTPPIMSWGKGNHSVRTGEWRYTRYRDGTEELYDHRVDHYEWTNLASRPAFRETCETLRHYLPHDQ